MAKTDAERAAAYRARMKRERKVGEAGVVPDVDLPSVVAMKDGGERPVAEAGGERTANMAIRRMMEVNRRLQSLEALVRLEATGGGLEKGVGQKLLDEVEYVRRALA